ncbi:hypothetical protein [Nostoc sp.]|uniref:hypothetical protein n=1 Tax=Nostoc sp. TaxID=1180 RepID=UPI002FFC47F0
MTFVNYLHRHLREAHDRLEKALEETSDLAQCKRLEEEGASDEEDCWGWLFPHTLYPPQQGLVMQKNLDW